ncbi:aconitase X catalytic domain-containing protein [Alphaproteobacteria bacterium]|nr:aconitase X catalytic domain-containing protein [Alphaproteobacteria bacterium]
MFLNDEENSMLNGEMGESKKWAIEHQIKVGNFFSAKDFISVSQAHMMVDPESIGEAGVIFLENLVKMGACVSVPTITDPRGVDLNYYKPLGQTENMANIDRRTIKACTSMGILMTNTCVNYQTIMPPVLGDHVAYGDTGVVIYSNSVCGARTNFEGGPSALAAGFTGRTPRYGLHLDKNRLPTKRFNLKYQPKDLTDWGILGAIVGKQSGSYWEVPIIEGLEVIPNSDEMKHLGAAMASYGSTPLFHLDKITPEAKNIKLDEFDYIDIKTIEKSDFDTLKSSFGQKGDKIDVVVFAAPQLSIVEMQRVADLCDKNTFKVPVIVCTSPQVYADALRMGFIKKIENSGAKVLEGTCFYNQYAREIGEANGWKRLLSNSTKIVNILGGYGYEPLLANMETCINSAVTGELI